MHPYRRSHVAAFIWAVCLSLPLSGCFTGSSDSGDSPSGGTSESREVDGPPPASSSGETASTEATEATEAGGGSGEANDGPGGGPNQQGASPVQEPQRPVPGQAPGPPAPNQPPAQPAPPAPVQPPAPPPGPPAPNQPPAPETVVLEWLPIGPVGRGDPTWYVALKSLNCDAGAADPGSSPTMQDLAPTLCLGLNGDEAAWESAVAALDTMPEPSADQCYDKAAYEVLRDIAAFRKQEPDAPYTLAARPGTACQPDLKYVEDTFRERQPTGVCADDVIILAGNLEGLPAGAVRSVQVGGVTTPVLYRESQPDDNYPPGDLYFLAPPPDPGSPTTVSVSVTADYPVESSATFEYAADQSTCTQATSTGP